MLNTIAAHVTCVKGDAMCAMRLWAFAMFASLISDGADGQHELQSDEVGEQHSRPDALREGAPARARPGRPPGLAVSVNTKVRVSAAAAKRWRFDRELTLRKVSTAMAPPSAEAAVVRAFGVGMRSAQAAKTVVVNGELETVTVRSPRFPAQISRCLVSHLEAQTKSLHTLLDRASEVHAFNVFDDASTWLSRQEQKMASALSLN